MSAGVPSVELSNSPLSDGMKYAAEPSVWVEHMWILFHMFFIMGAWWGQNQGLYGALKFTRLRKSLEGLRGELAALYIGERMNRVYKSSPVS